MDLFEENSVNCGFIWRKLSQLWIYLKKTQSTVDLFEETLWTVDLFQENSVNCGLIWRKLSHWLFTDSYISLNWVNLELTESNMSV